MCCRHRLYAKNFLCGLRREQSLNVSTDLVESNKSTILAKQTQYQYPNSRSHLVTNASMMGQASGRWMETMIAPWRLSHKTERVSSIARLLITCCWVRASHKDTTKTKELRNKKQEGLKTWIWLQTMRSRMRLVKMPMAMRKSKIPRKMAMLDGTRKITETLGKLIQSPKWAQLFLFI